MRLVVEMAVMLGLLAPGLSSALSGGATARPRLVSSPPGKVGVPWTGVLAASGHPVVVARLGAARQRVRATRMRPGRYRLRAIFAMPGRWTLNVGRFRIGTFVVRPQALRLVHAVDVVIEPDGALLVVDVASNRVFRQSTGRLSVVAGNGRSGRSGDGGPAARAATGFPIEVALHPRGGFGLVHDERYIRHVDASGTISTTVELDQPTALAYDAAGNLFVSELGGRVQRIGTDGARTTYAGFSQPHGLAVAPDGSVYVCDTFNNRVQRILPDGTVTTFAAGLSSPNDLALGQNGTVYVADFGTSRILRISSTGVVATVTSAAEPSSVAVAPDGTVYFTERGRGAVRSVSPRPQTSGP